MVSCGIYRIYVAYVKDFNFLIIRFGKNMNFKELPVWTARLIRFRLRFVEEGEEFGKPKMEKPISEGNIDHEEDRGFDL